MGNRPAQTDRLREKLIKEADLEENTVDEVLRILRYEFEDEENSDENPE